MREAQRDLIRERERLADLNALLNDLNGELEKEKQLAFEENNRLKLEKANQELEAEKLKIVRDQLTAAGLAQQNEHRRLVAANEQLDLEKKEARRNARAFAYFLSESLRSAWASRWRMETLPHVSPTRLLRVSSKSTAPS